MFQQLVPLLRQRSVLLTVTSLEEDHRFASMFYQRSSQTAKTLPSPRR